MSLSCLYFCELKRKRAYISSIPKRHIVHCQKMYNSPARYLLTAAVQQLMAAICLYSTRFLFFLRCNEIGHRGTLSALCCHYNQHRGSCRSILMFRLRGFVILPVMKEFQNDHKLHSTQLQNNWRLIFWPETLIYLVSVWCSPHKHIYDAFFIYYFALQYSEDLSKLMFVYTNLVTVLRVLDLVNTSVTRVG